MNLYVQHLHSKLQIDVIYT